MNPSSNSTLKQQMYDQLCNDILMGVYGPEQPFTEGELVKRFKISKSPIREALIELQNEGVLRSIPRFGYEVIRISEREVQEAKQYRIILECGAMDYHWNLLTEDKVLQINEYQDQPSQELDVLHHWERNSRFHLDLMHCYSNAYMYRALESSLRLMTRAYVQFQRNRWQDTKFVGTSRTHRDVIQAILNQDKQSAINLLKEDIQGFGTK